MAARAATSPSDTQSRRMDGRCLKLHFRLTTKLYGDTFELRWTELQAILQARLSTQLYGDTRRMESQNSTVV
jgi:hypothetical protein